MLTDRKTPLDCDILEALGFVACGHRGVDRMQLRGSDPLSIAVEYTNGAWYAYGDKIPNAIAPRTPAELVALLERLGFGVEPIVGAK